MAREKTWIKPFRILCILFVVGLYGCCGEGYGYKNKVTRNGVLSVRSYNFPRESEVFNHQTRRTGDNKRLSQVDLRTNSLSSLKTHRRKKKSHRRIAGTVKSKVKPTLIKKTLRNENGVLLYRPVEDFPFRRPSKKGRRRKNRPSYPRSRSHYSSKARRRRTKLKRRNKKKTRKPQREKQTYSPTLSTKDTKKTYREKIHKPASTITSKTTRISSKPSRAPAPPTTPVVYSRNPDFDVLPTVQKGISGTHASAYDTEEESPNVIGLRRLYSSQNNPHGLQAPRGFRIRSTSVNSISSGNRKAKPVERVLTPRSTSLTKTSKMVRRHGPTNPSASILEIPTTSVDDAYSLLRGLGTGFRVKLVPTSGKAIDISTAQSDEFDIARPTVMNVNQNGMKKEKQSAIDTLKALFSKLSNASAFQPPRRSLNTTPKILLESTPGSIRNWWLGPHVCVSGSPGVFGLPANLFDRLEVSTQCSEIKDRYSCTERYGTGVNAPSRTTSYRCCAGYRVSHRTRKCEQVRRLESNQNGNEVQDLAKGPEVNPRRDETLSEDLTIFMPSDSVVNNYLKESGVDDEDKDNIELFLENHVVAGKNLSSRSLKNNQILTAMSGNSIRVNFFQDGLMTVNCKRVLQKDVANANSLVHIIGDVLEEVTGTAYQYLERHRNRFSMFLSLVDAAGLSPFLQSPKENITLFVPTNEVLESSHEIPETPACIKKIVENHISKTIVCSSSWSEMGKAIKSQAYQKLLLTSKKGKNFVNNVKNIEQDIMTTNGVIHVIDGVLQTKKVQSVLSLIKNDHESSIMLNLLELGGMKSALTTGDNFTVIVPTNKAFEKLPATFTDRLKRNPGDLRKFLLYHTVPRKITNQMLTKPQSLQTLDPPHSIRIQKYDVRVRGGKSKGVYRLPVTSLQCARVPDVRTTQACNGAVVHVNQVMLPPTGSVLEALRQAPPGNFSIFLRAISRSKMGQLFAKTEEITLFAPTNDAFERLPSRFVKFLFQNVRALQKILKFHITKGFHCCDKLLQDYYKLPTLHDASVAVCPKKGRILLGRSKNRLRAKVTKCGLPASNGIIHAIDKVLIPAGLRN